MADIWGTIETNKKIIILAGFIVGVAYIMEFLPKDITLFGEYTSYFYVALILFPAYVYFRYHWQPAPMKQDVQRNMSDPRFLRSNPQMRQPVRPQGAMPRQQPPAMQQGRPANELYDKFKND